MMIYNFIKEIFPIVDAELEKWKREAELIPCAELRTQALASIAHKKFHCQGGSIYALYPGVCKKNILRFIVAFQTISDYLDNLCDRAGCEDGNAFRLLHKSYIDAVSPMDKGESSNSDINSCNRVSYYDLYPYREDGGYLQKLVAECRNVLSEMQNYKFVKKDVLELAQLYCDLQTYKHIALDKREKRMIDWAQSCDCSRFGTSTWEFAAATGSTLGIFMLCTIASLQQSPEQKQLNDIKNAYFPWICGFHILLDYFIDQDEDRENNDLNFVFYYRNREEEKERLSFFAAKSLESARILPHSGFHSLVVKGLSSMYLSDVKANGGITYTISRDILRKCGIEAVLMHKLCKYLRKKTLL